MVASERAVNKSKRPSVWSRVKTWWLIHRMLRKPNPFIGPGRGQPLHDLASLFGQGSVPPSAPRLFLADFTSAIAPALPVCPARPDDTADVPWPLFRYSTLDDNAAAMAGTFDQTEIEDLVSHTAAGIAAEVSGSNQVPRQAAASSMLARRLAVIAKLNKPLKISVPERATVRQQPVQKGRRIAATPFELKSIRTEPTARSGSVLSANVIRFASPVRMRIRNADHDLSWLAA